MTPPENSPNDIEFVYLSDILAVVIKGKQYNHRHTEVLLNIIVPIVYSELVC